MANIKFSEQTAATTPLDRTESVPILQSGSNRKATVKDIQDAGRPVTTVALYAGSNQSITGSNFPSNRMWLNNTPGFYRLPMVLANFTQVRLVAKLNTLGAAGSKLSVRYTDGFSATANAATNAGASAASQLGDGVEVEVPFTTSTFQDSGWINLASGAISPSSGFVLIGPQTEGGDGTTSPSLFGIYLMFRP